MRVDRDGVGALDAAQTPAVLLGEREAAAVCRINVEPETVLARDVGQLVERVNDAGRGRARRARDAARACALPRRSLSIASRSASDADVKALVRLDLAQVLAAEAEDVHALDERVVTLLGSVDDKVAGRASSAARVARAFVPRGRART